MGRLGSRERKVCGTIGREGLGRERVVERVVRKKERETVREGLFLQDSWSFECRVMM